jgi:hypothetical protein
VDVPEGQNDLRKHQLRELALLNGTLREGEVPRFEILFHKLFHNPITNYKLKVYELWSF